MRSTFGPPGFTCTACIAIVIAPGRPAGALLGCPACGPEPSFALIDHSVAGHGGPSEPTDDYAPEKFRRHSNSPTRGRYHSACSRVKLAAFFTVLWWGSMAGCA